MGIVRKGGLVGGCGCGCKEGWSAVLIGVEEELRIVTAVAQGVSYSS
jgi:hypothetical protein